MRRDTPIDGIPRVKREAARFAKLFLDINVDPAGCVPVVGSMQGAFATFLTANRNDHTRKGTLFIDPGFPVQKQQCAVLGHEYDSFDIADFRGEKLRDQLEQHLRKGEISSVLYSNPNNPSWVCLDEEELRIIGETAKKYDVTVIEDLAYFGMDFRVDYGQPGKPPYQPTVARYTDNYVLLLSTSKFFSYAGERAAVILVSNALYNRRYPDLLRYYNSDMFGHALIYGAIYALTAGAPETGRPIPDGFYFTVSYPGMTGDELLRELLYYGISAIGLAITGSVHSEGLRACVSRFTPEFEPLLTDRLRRFRADHELPHEIST